MELKRAERRHHLATRDYARLAAFRHSLRRFLRFSEEAAAADGITGQHYQAMLILRACPEGQRTTINDLAQQLLIKHNSAVELVDRLEKRNLVKRERSDVHRSFVFVRITKTGEMMLRKLVASRKADLQVAGPILVKALTTLTKQQAKQKKDK